MWPRRKNSILYSHRFCAQVIFRSLGLTILDGMTDIAAYVKAVQEGVSNVDINVINLQDVLAKLRVEAETKKLGTKHPVFGNNYILFNFMLFPRQLRNDKKCSAG